MRSARRIVPFGLPTFAHVCYALRHPASYLLARLETGATMMVAKKRIGNRDVEALQPGEVVWDGEVSGFGARRQRSTAVAYVLIYRTAEGRQRWHTIGKHGSPWTPTEARKEAKRLLGSVVDGVDPAALKRAKRKAKTVGELCDLYLADAEAGRILTRRKRPKKTSTILTDRGRILRHIKPLLGSHAVASVTRSDVDAFMQDVAEGKTATKAKSGKPRGVAHVRGGKGTATRTVGLLGSIFTYAVRHRMRSDNPVRGVERVADEQRTRRLSDDEYSALGALLRQGDALEIWPPAIDLTRFLLLTGWRRGEGLGLRRREVNLARRVAELGDTKTGYSVRPLSNAAADLLRARMAQVPDKPDALLFPATRGDGVMSGYPKLCNRLVALAGVSDEITPHIFRHSFASVAGDLGFSDSTIGVLIGHKARTVTGRYVHNSDAVLLAAADTVARRTLELMGEQVSGVVVELNPAGGRRSA